MAGARRADVYVLGAVRGGLRGDDRVEAVDVGLEVVGVGREDRLDGPAAAGLDVEAVTGDHHAGVRRLRVNAVEDRGELRTDGVDPCGDLVDAARGVAALAGGAERVELDAVFGDAHQARVVATDGERHQGGVGGQRVELRRRGTHVDAEQGQRLRLRHVLGVGAAARHVAQLVHTEARREFVCVVVGRTAARDRAGDVRDQRPGRHRVAQCDVHLPGLGGRRRGGRGAGAGRHEPQQRRGRQDALATTPEPLPVRGLHDASCWSRDSGTHCRTSCRLKILGLTGR